MANAAKVFLLSNKKDHYDAFINHGYSNILWFKSTPEVLHYLRKHPNVFDSVDIVMVRNIFYEGKNGKKLYDKIYRNSFINSLFYVEESYSKYTLLTNKTARTNLRKRDVFSILGSCNFDNKHSHNNVLISKGNNSLKILFCGAQSYFNLVHDFFERQGIDNVKCVSNIAINNKEVFKGIADYDIIISSNTNHVINCVDELSYYLCDKDHMIFLANFDLSHMADTNMAQLSFADTFSRDMDRKIIHTVKDNQTLYHYILNVIMQEYSKLNDKVKLANLKTFNEILDEYIEYRDTYVSETEALLNKLLVIDSVEILSRRFISKHMRYSRVRDFEGLRFERINNGIRISFVHEGEIIVRITYYTNGINLKSPYYKEFNLELKNSKGYLMALGMRSIYDDRRGVIENAPDIISDEDFIKIEGVYKKLLVLTEKSKNKTLFLK